MKKLILLTVAGYMSRLWMSFEVSLMAIVYRMLSFSTKRIFSSVFSLHSSKIYFVPEVMPVFGYADQDASKAHLLFYIIFLLKNQS